MLASILNAYHPAKLNGWRRFSRSRSARILFTPNFAPREEYEWALNKGLQVTLDNLYPLQAWPELFKGKKLFIRIDPGQGRGHHEHVKTAGVHSKFGVPRFEIGELASLVDLRALKSSVSMPTVAAAFWILTTGVVLRESSS